MIWYDIIWYILTYIHTFWTSRGRFGEVHALYHWNVNSSVASSTSDGIYLMDVTPPPYPTPPQPNDKKSYVPAMFDYQRVDAIELFISTCAPLGQSGQVMSSYVKLFISFPIFFVTFWLRGYPENSRLGTFWGRHESEAWYGFFSWRIQGWNVGNCCNCSWEKGWQLINYEI